MWLVVLSDQLLIVALVSRYLTNRLISHRPLRSREALAGPPLSSVELMRYYPTFRLVVPHERTRSDVLLTRSPLVVGVEQAPPHVTVRLACVKRSASVQSEPGSNSIV